MPSSVTATIRGVFSCFSAVEAIGRFTSTPDSLTKLVVTRKKMRRINTISIRGAILISAFLDFRSMPKPFIGLSSFNSSFDFNRHILKPDTKPLYPCKQFISVPRNKGDKKQTRYSQDKPGFSCNQCL